MLNFRFSGFARVTINVTHMIFIFYYLSVITMLMVQTLTFSTLNNN